MWYVVKGINSYWGKVDLIFYYIIICEIGGDSECWYFFGLGGFCIGGLWVLILVLLINYWDIVKSLVGVDKKKIVWIFRLYGVIYFYL